MLVLSISGYIGILVVNNLPLGACKYNVSYGQAYSWTRKSKQDGPEALIDRRGKGKNLHDQLTEDERRDLEVKRLRARIEHLSTENAVLKKLQELERLDATHNTPTKRFKR
ncbi:helix-turn-helix domain-containing protein [Lactiplantibacillus paraplantarum]|nr:helix-turn-helix domain-containing protein [Lactiplantibacillus paraplantarum]WEE36047.1 helix-turn-helix domain-containing protein [Lactiplantibacillus paraplantarum]